MAIVKKPLAVALGAAFLATSIAPLASAASNPFSAQQLSGGYALASHQKDGEGKCGDKKAAHEGSCGDGKAAADGSAVDTKAAGEGSCGDMKAGEGSCGDMKAADTVEDSAK